MSTEVSTKIQELPRIQSHKLRALWQELFAKPPNPRLRRNLMIPILAYRLQERAYGGLRPSTRKCLQKLAAEGEQNHKAPVRLGLQFKPGTKLLRQWQGEMHEVLVIDDGVEYRGKSYRSLSEIAREITGTHWSGPLFFGLKRGGKARPAQ